MLTVLILRKRPKLTFHKLPINGLHLLKKDNIVRKQIIVRKTDYIVRKTDYVARKQICQINCNLPQISLQIH